MQKIFVLFCGLLIAVIAEAQTPSTEAVTVIQESPKLVLENSSEFNRMNKKYEVSLMPVGFGPGTSTGFKFGYYLNRNSSVSFSYENGNKGYSCWGSLNCDYSSQALGIHLKKFVSNSFYYVVGIDRRQISYAEQSTDSPFNYSYGFSGTSTVVAIMIGNQWQWENFSVGCDWIGLLYPLTTSVENEPVSGDYASGQASMERKEDFFVKNTIAQGLRFYVGASF